MSFNKTFAKMGSDYKKPFATTEITRANYRDILWPLPASDLFFVGKASAARLSAMNIKTIGDIARADERLLFSAFGKHGIQMKESANGLDDAPVLPYDTKREYKSVGNGITFKRDLKTEDDIKTALTALSDRVAVRLRKHALRCRGVKLDIKDKDFITISRQMQLPGATDLARDLYDYGLDLVLDNWTPGRPIRLITLTAINLLESGDEDSVQLSIFDDAADQIKADEKEAALEQTLDEIRKKMGRHAVVSGNLIGNDLGIIIDEQ